MLEIIIKPIYPELRTAADPNQAFISGQWVRIDDGKAVLAQSNDSEIEQIYEESNINIRKSFKTVSGLYEGKTDQFNNTHYFVKTSVLTVKNGILDLADSEDRIFAICLASPEAGILRFKRI